MFRQIAFYLVSSSLLLLLSFRHPYHLGVTTVQYNPVTEQLNIDIKLFYHDLEPVVNTFGHTDIDIKNHSNAAQRDSLVYAYVGQHFSAKVDGQDIFLLKGKISFKDEYIYIGFTSGAKGKTVSFINTICYETEPTQTHLFHFVEPNKPKQSKKLVNPTSGVSFAL